MIGQSAVTDAYRQASREPGQVRRSLVRGLTAGPVPVLIGVALIWVFFETRNSGFLSPRNLSNLSLQMAVIALLGMGASVVIIAGEFDISVGAELGVTAGLLGVVLSHGWPSWAAICVVLAAGICLGLVQGAVVVFAGIPSFIVTLGGFLVYTGLQQQLIGSSGSIPINDPFILGIANQYLPDLASWLMVGIFAVAAAAREIARRREWNRAGLPGPGRLRSVATVTVPIAILALVVGYFNDFSGVARVVVLLLVVTLVLDSLTQRTLFGRFLYATGGNPEAARRAGAPVWRIRLAVFGIAGLLAGVAGIVSASRLYSVSADNGGGALLLQAVAAAVIGGTSLYGGRGRVYSALLGALVIVSIENGLDLLGQSTATTNEATGLILVAAVLVDALSRRAKRGVRTGS
jgi:D-xylose transport system permease protein